MPSLPPLLHWLCCAGHGTRRPQRAAGHEQGQAAAAFHLNDSSGSSSSSTRSDGRSRRGSSSGAARAAPFVAGKQPTRGSVCGQLPQRCNRLPGEKGMKNSTGAVMATWRARVARQRALQQRSNIHAFPSLWPGRSSCQLLSMCMQSVSSAALPAGWPAGKQVERWTHVCLAAAQQRRRQHRQRRHRRQQLAA